MARRNGGRMRHGLKVRWESKRRGSYCGMAVAARTSLVSSNTGCALHRLKPHLLAMYVQRPILVLLTPNVANTSLDVRQSKPSTSSVPDCEMKYDR